MSSLRALWQDRVVWGRPIGAALLGLGLGVACQSGAFSCADDGDCGGHGGVCTDGFCAFPSDDCDSGLAYGEHSGSLSGTCVPMAGEGSTGAGTATADGGDGSGDGASATTDPTSPGSTSGPSTGDSTGSPPLGDVEFTDDELAGEFAEGTFIDTQWNGTRLTLAAGTGSGEFLSRVYDAGAEAQWTTLRWEPDAPYAKALPDARQSEVGYGSGDVSMQDNVLLMHFDASGPLPAGTSVADASGHGSDGVVADDAAILATTEGRFGLAIDDDLESWVSIDTAQADALHFGTDDFTWSMWFRTELPCATNYVFMGVDDMDTPPNDTPHLWLGCTNDDWQECPGGTANHLGGVFRSVHGDGTDGTFFCDPTPIDDGTWHHVAVVKEGHDMASVRLYLDGAQVYEVAASFVAEIVYPSEPDFVIGGFSRGTYPTAGTFDEVAIWRRALDPAEIAALAARGALDLRLSVRVCTMPDCSDAPPFVGGPDLAPGETFADPPDALAPGTELSVQGLPAGRYVQYRVAFSGRVDTVAPALASVTLRGTI